MPKSKQKPVASTRVPPPKTISNIAGMGRFHDLTATQAKKFSANQEFVKVFQRLAAASDHFAKHAERRYEADQYRAKELAEKEGVSVPVSSKPVVGPGQIYTHPQLPHERISNVGTGAWYCSSGFVSKVVAFSASWDQAHKDRNIDVAVNGAADVDLLIPLKWNPPKDPGDLHPFKVQCTEYQILQAFMDAYPNPSGLLVLTTEKFPCESCCHVIGQFLAKRSGVELCVYFEDGALNAVEVQNFFALSLEKRLILSAITQGLAK